MTHQKKKSIVVKSRKKSPESIEEIKLFRRIKAGDENAKAQLIKNHYDWVLNIARKYHSYFPNIELSELIAEGNRGVLEAMDHFDVSKAAKFSTYSWFWIIKNIQEYITTNNELIELPHKMMLELKKVINTMNDEIKKGKSPTFETISKKLSLNADVVREWLTDRDNLSKPVSLDKYLNEEDKETSLSETVEDKSNGTIQELLDKVNKKADITGIIRRLTPIEQRIIKLRFGFIDEKFHSLKEIGEKLCMGPAKIKDIESAAIMKLKKFLYNLYEIDGKEQ